MKTIITVLGADKPGIIAKLSGVLFEMNANILDITQTVVGGNLFTMTMFVDLAEANVDFPAYKERIAGCATELQMEINVQREDIFSAMHRI